MAKVKAFRHTIKKTTVEFEPKPSTGKAKRTAASMFYGDRLITFSSGGFNYARFYKGNAAKPCDGPSQITVRYDSIRQLDFCEKTGTYSYQIVGDMV